MVMHPPASEPGVLNVRHVPMMEKFGDAGGAVYVALATPSEPVTMVRAESVPKST